MTNDEPNATRSCIGTCPDGGLRGVGAKKPRGPAVVRRVLEVTLEELGRVGLAGLSLPRVADLAGINKTSLYRRWPTKEALVAAALELSMPNERDLPDHGDVEADLADLIRELSAFLTSPAGMGVIRIAFADGQTPQTRLLATSMQHTGSTRAPRKVLERAIRRGELRSTTDIDLLLHTIGGAVLHRVFVERKSADARWARRFIRLLVEGAKARS